MSAFSVSSCSTDAFLRTSLSFRNVDSLSVQIFSLSCSALSPAVASFDAAAPNCLTSRVFWARKARALPMLACAAEAAFSHSAMESLASCAGRTSRPLRNGSSASLTFSMADSTSSIFSVPSFTKPSPSTRSRWSLVAATTLARAFRAWSQRPCSLSRASFRGGAAVARLPSTERWEALRIFSTALAPVSIFSSASSESFSSPSPDAAGFAKHSSFSTSSSASLILTSSCPRISLPLASFSPELAARLVFARSCCAAFRRPCSLLTIAAASEPDFASLCLTEMIFRASTHALDASFSFSAQASEASRSASTETSDRSSFEKISPATHSALTASSAAVTLSVTSDMMDAVLR
mmetsp:Transcript_104546/g.291617  ORF Transcript_104546/g.291617 Transcript_104546/m.291617 type:complete len:351 (-) Transcript_104546:1292-2344(-)